MNNRRRTAGRKMQFIPANSTTTKQKKNALGVTETVERQPTPARFIRHK